MPKLKRTCLNCGKEFEKERIFVEKYNRGKYCSRKCYYEAIEGEKINVQCLNCGKKMLIYKHILKFGKGKYCSINCRAFGMYKFDLEKWRKKMYKMYSDPNRFDWLKDKKKAKLAGERRAKTMRRNIKNKIKRDQIEIFNINSYKKL